MIGSRIDHYRILDRLGSGGMGVVWLAEDEELGRKVALKTLRDDLAASPEKRARFDREARAVAALNHPNIVTLYSTGQSGGGQRFLVMEYVEGTTLDEAIPAGGLPASEVLRIGADVADALAAAHAHGIVHRDLKPGNVLLGKQGRVKVVDFGLARALAGERDPLESHTGQTSLTQEGMAVGTLHYMSPEQLQLRRVDHRTDLFSLGVVLFEMATGELPFPGDSAAMVISAMLRDHPRRIDERQAKVPPQIADLVDRLLAKDPADRPQTAAEVRDALDAAARLLTSETATLPTPRTSGALRRNTMARPAPAARRRAIWIALPAAALLVAALAWLGSRHRAGPGPVPPQPTPGATEATVAVLPLEDFAGDPDYFTDGMTDTLINALARIDGLRVISRQSAIRFKKSDKSLPEIANELHADYVVEGSVARNGDQVQLQAHLMKPKPEESVWANTYARPAGEVLEMSDELAQAVAAAIDPKLQRLPVSGGKSMSAEEFDQLLRAAYYSNELTPESVGRSVEIYHAVIARDPRSAGAWSGLAVDYGLLGFFGTPPDEASTQATDAVEHALALDPSLPDAYAARGFVLQFYRWDWEGAERAYRRALELNPSDASSHHRMWALLATLGRWPEATEQLREAERLDPLSVSILISVGKQFALGGDSERGVREIRRALALDPGNGAAQFDLWQLLHHLGRDPDRGDALLAALRGFGLKESVDVATALRAHGYAAAVEKAAEAFADAKHYAFNTAALYTAAGAPDEALFWLRKGFVARAPDMHWIGVEPLFEPLRGRREFQELMRGLRLQPQTAPPAAGTRE